MNSVFLIRKVQELGGSRSGRGMIPIILKLSADREVLASAALHLAGTYHPQHPMLADS